MALVLRGLRQGVYTGGFGMSDYDDDPAYIGKKPCGCVVAMTTGENKYMAKDVAGYLMSGYDVELTTIKDGKSRLARCFCKENKP